MGHPYFKLPRINELIIRSNFFSVVVVHKTGRRETIVFLEKGKYNPSLRLAYDIAKAFGERIEDVFLFDEE